MTQLTPEEVTKQLKELDRDLVLVDKIKRFLKTNNIDPQTRIQSKIEGVSESLVLLMKDFSNENNMNKAAQIYAERTNPDAKVTGKYLNSANGMFGTYIRIGYDIETPSGTEDKEVQLSIGEYLAWLTEQLETK